MKVKQTKNIARAISLTATPINGWLSPFCSSINLYKCNGDWWVERNHISLGGIQEIT
jgi:hypothetical protein